MSHNLPPIVKCAEHVLSEVEKAFATMKRKYRYPFGNDLRQAAYGVVKAALLAWHDRANIARQIERLDWAVRGLKVRLQVACNIRAFASFAQFEALARLVHDLGRQVGGWKRQHHPQSQNGGRVSPGHQRAMTLSARTASRHGAAP
jgi:hypothetical protein